MQLINIYFPGSWWEVGILLIFMIFISFIAKWIMWSGNKKMDLPFATFFIVVIAIVLFWLIIAKGLPEINSLFNQINIPEVSPWVWVGLAVVILLAVFGPRVVKSGRKTWVGSLIGLTILIGVGVIVYTQIDKEKSQSLYSGNNQTNSVSSTTPSYPRYNLDGENVMKKDEWKEFNFVARDASEPTFHFDSPKGYGRFIITYQKKGNPSVTWKREFWRDTTGEVHRKLLGSKPPPFDGPCLVKTNKDCVVLAETKIIK